MNEPFDYIWVGNLKKRMPYNSTLYVAYFVSDAYYFAVECSHDFNEFETLVYRFIGRYNRDLKAMKLMRDKQGNYTEEYIPGYTIYKYKQWKKDNPTKLILKPEPFI